MPQIISSQRHNSGERFWALIEELTNQEREFALDVRERVTLMVDNVTYALERSDLRDQSFLVRLEEAVLCIKRQPSDEAEREDGSGTGGHDDPGPSEPGADSGFRLRMLDGFQWPGCQPPLREDQQLARHDSPESHQPRA